MTDDIVPPEIPEAKIPFTDDQLRAIYARIELIEQHFDRCCAFQLNQCRHGEEWMANRDR